jgi:hypothetical protein
MCLPFILLFLDSCLKNYTFLVHCIFYYYVGLCGQRGHVQKRNTYRVRVGVSNRTYNEQKKEIIHIYSHYMFNVRDETKSI